MKSARNQPQSSHARSTTPAAAKLVQSGKSAESQSLQLRSYHVGALPLVNHILRRLDLFKILSENLPADDPRIEMPTARAILLLVRNVLLCRQPLYAVPEWAAQSVPHLLDLYNHELPLLHDDRMGRSLQRLFHGLDGGVIVAVVRKATQEFDLALDELHNDSTSISVFGAYKAAAEEGELDGKATHAITWGHSKDHRPDLKQLLYTLTITEDGGVPVYFTSASGNVVDDQTHCDTWDILRKLVGHANFLYVADCKLASEKNLSYIARHGGRFVTVMPRSHREDLAFRSELRQIPLGGNWCLAYEVLNTERAVVDTFSTWHQESTHHGGYRLLWYHSTRKAETDRASRMRSIDRASRLLEELKGKLTGPRSRIGKRVQIDESIERILRESEAAAWLSVTVHEQSRETFRQAGRGRPTEKTRYVKTTRPTFTITWQVRHDALLEAERDDGVFPLLTNDRAMTAEQVLRAYKRQPVIEKRFSQFKTDFAVAPVYLKNVARIQGLLAVYFLVLLVQTLLERELRRAMVKSKIPSLPIYPENRACRRPTFARIVELFDRVDRHLVWHAPDTASPEYDETHADVLSTELTPSQRQVVELLGLDPDHYGD